MITQATDGKMVWRWDQADHFGMFTPQENRGAFVYDPRFPGQVYDRETNNHYNYFRDYDPQTGRYIQSDPIGLEGGINIYSYVSNQPTRYTDPSGLQGCAPMMTPEGPVCMPLPPIVAPGNPEVVPTNRPFWPEWIRNIIASVNGSDSSSGPKVGANSGAKNCPDKDLCDKWFEDDVESCNNRYGNGLRGDTFKSMLRGCLQHAQTRRDRCYRGEADLDPWTDDRSGIPTPGRRNG